MVQAKKKNFFIQYLFMNNNVYKNMYNKRKFSIDFLLKKFDLIFKNYIYKIL